MDAQPDQMGLFGSGSAPTEAEVDFGWLIVLNASGCPRGSGLNPESKGLIYPDESQPQRRAYTAALGVCAGRSPRPDREAELWHWAHQQPADPDGWRVGQEPTNGGDS